MNNEYSVYFKKNNKYILRKLQKTDFDKECAKLFNYDLYKSTFESFVQHLDNNNLVIVAECNDKIVGSINLNIINRINYTKAYIDDIRTNVLDHIVEKMLVKEIINYCQTNEVDEINISNKYRDYFIGEHKPKICSQFQYTDEEFIKITNL